MLSPLSSPLLLVFLLLLPTSLLARPSGGDQLLASVKEKGTEDYEVRLHCSKVFNITILAITT